jgi:hypothetical protein
MSRRWHDAARQHRGTIHQESECVVGAPRRATNDRYPSSRCPVCKDAIYADQVISVFPNDEIYHLACSPSTKKMEQQIEEGRRGTTASSSGSSGGGGGGGGGAKR